MTAMQRLLAATAPITRRRAFTAGIVLGTAFGVGGSTLVGKTAIMAVPFVWGYWKVRRYVRAKRIGGGKVDGGLSREEDARAGRAGMFEGIGRKTKR